MPIEPPDPMAMADVFRIQAENLRQLAAMNTHDTFYTQAAEQLSAIVVGLESRASPTKPPATQT